MTMRRRARFRHTWGISVVIFQGFAELVVSSLSLRGERQAFRRRDKSFDVLAPKLTGGSLFGFIPATIVNCGNFPDHAGSMVQVVKEFDAELARRKRGD